MSKNFSGDRSSYDMNELNCVPQIRRLHTELYKFARTWDFDYFLSSMILRIHSFCCGFVPNYFFDGVTVKTSNIETLLHLDLRLYVIKKLMIKRIFSNFTYGYIVFQFNPSSNFYFPLFLFMIAIRFYPSHSRSKTFVNRFYYSRTPYFY